MTSPFGSRVRVASPFGGRVRVASPFGGRVRVASPFGGRVQVASPFGSRARVTSPFGSRVLEGLSLRESGSGDLSLRESGARGTLPSGVGSEAGSRECAEVVVVGRECDNSWRVGASSGGPGFLERCRGQSALSPREAAQARGRRVRRSCRSGARVRQLLESGREFWRPGLLEAVPRAVGVLSEGDGRPTRVRGRRVRRSCRSGGASATTFAEWGRRRGRAALRWWQGGGKGAPGRDRVQSPGCPTTPRSSPCPPPRSAVAS
ncbi:hypothetical protein SAMN06295885_0599 [Rathayibacter oskolensis]|uniref:Uncharacterized protein n=1 Tax=Rathayibacter oskolensis TaxID=1891671 RepID=A0A1X7N2R8_9MICO|nr:hypothetical protein SAMN06295885_0599 [Rathayibacter oskolensis]